MERRAFCHWMSVGLIANCLPMALAACTSKNAKAGSGTDNFQKVGTLAQLDREGQILSEQIPNTPILVVRKPTNPETLLAVNPTCTHRECSVKWNKEQGIFLCGCHDSRFDTAGNALNSPARDPLTIYSVKVEGESILVSAEG